MSLLQHCCWLPSSEDEHIKERICNAKNANFPKFSLVEISILIIIGVYMFVAQLNGCISSHRMDLLAYGVNYAKIIFQKGAILSLLSFNRLEMSASYPPAFSLSHFYISPETSTTSQNTAAFRFSNDDCHTI
jgi:hypothetical protein